MCNKRGPQLVSDEGILFRQVRPTWFTEDGIPTSQAFWPWRNVDECCLSVDRSTVTTAQKSYELFTNPAPNGFNQASGGVWSIRMDDVQNFTIALWEDQEPATDRAPQNPAHAVIDFKQLPEKQREKLGRMFKVKALQRGKMYPTSERN